ncbi:MAG TPA: toll/interleukin-1 receptor domain-containing protein [Thermoanaerobaculia bacterium]|nr:toll/interleukin-1 receptor domain-containing protein [Thermoanaerobaculia bacterium]
MSPHAQLLQRALEFNLQIDATITGEGEALRRTAERHVPADLIPALKTIGIEVELLIERSVWTCRCDRTLKAHGPASSPAQERLYCACFRLYHEGHALWASQLLRPDGPITGIVSHFYDQMPATVDTLAGARVFIAYSGKRELLVRQIREFLERFRVSVWDYQHSSTIDSRAGAELLLPSLKEQIDASETVIAIDDQFSQQSVWTTAEILHAIDRDHQMVIPVRVADQYMVDRISPAGELTHYRWPHLVAMCVCHWPERLWEIATWVAYRHRQNMLGD